MDIHIIEIGLKLCRSVAQKIQMFEAMQNFAERQNDKGGYHWRSIVLRSIDKGIHPG